MAVTIFGSSERGSKIWIESKPWPSHTSSFTHIPESRLTRLKCMQPHWKSIDTVPKKYYSAITWVIWVFVYSVVFIEQTATNWPLARIWGVSQWGQDIFGDGRLVLQSSDCYAHFEGRAKWSDIGWGTCRYIYGTQLMHFLHFLQINSHDVRLLGWVFCVTVVLILATSSLLLTTNSKFRWKALVFLVFASPGNFLLVERANFDALILLLLTCASLLFTDKFWPISISLAAAAAAFKFYPVIWFGMPLALPGHLRRKIVMFLAGLASMLWVLLELIRRRPIIPMDVGAAFGAPSFGLWINQFAMHFHWDFYVPNLVSQLMGFAILAGTVWIVYKAPKFFGTSTIERRIVSSTPGDRLGIAAGIMFLACFVAGESYDYRLFFAMAWSLYLTSKAHRGEANRTFYIWISVAVSWLSYNSGVLGQMLGDIATDFLAAISILILTGIFRARLPFLEEFKRTLKGFRIYRLLLESLSGGVK